MNLDSELEVLSPEECISLAATMPIGRIVFTDRALPAVQPVNFLIDDGSVVIRTTQGSKLAAATRNAVVAFEVDEIDRRSQAGWSVTLVGRAQSVRDPAESARLARLPLQTWAPGARDRFIRIRPEHISGRRLPASVPGNGSTLHSDGTAPYGEGSVAHGNGATPPGAGSNASGEDTEDYRED